ncbi:MAG TPA: FAD-dependent oxidoreductase [Acidimicrobiia bacterium]|nr:FAD-dependent oxidoreductase [Acidimicrobiia bacterium]
MNPASSPPSPQRVVVLGGGIAGLAAAWELSKTEHRDQVESITIYQRGWRLGGKGASSRGAHGRIEEHGLHVWLGYYENAFRLIRECYEELDRPSSDPDAPIRAWTDGFVAASRIGLGEPRDDGWLPWTATFSEDDGTPGAPGATSDAMTVTELVRRAVSLLRDLIGSLPARPSAARPTPPLVLTASAVPPDPPSPAPAAVGQLVRDVTLLALVGALEVAVTGQALTDALGAPDDRLVAPVRASIDAVVDRLRTEIRDRVGDDHGARRLWQVVDLVGATMRGIVADELLTAPDGFAAIDDWDYRDWIAHHGASPDTLDSPLVRGVYDLVFGYEHGDDHRPRFAAGTGLLLSAKLFLDYRGAIFWKMTAGMGEVVFAPLYQVLRARGVRFEFFHRIDALRVSDDGTRIDGIDVGVQARVRGDEPYEPLIRVGGLPCWPASAPDELLEAPAAEDLESFWSTSPAVSTRTLRRGVDFDTAVLAIPVGMHHHVCGELVANPRTPEWRAMTDGLGTVATQAVQLWLTADETTLGAPSAAGTVTGVPGAFHTQASMSHLLAVEQWPPGERPASIVYSCHTLPDVAAPRDDDVGYPARRLDDVRANTIEFLRHGIARTLPGTSVDGDFDWNALFDPGDADGEARLDAQYLRANVDPSDRYVLSLPGTGRLRLRADESGYDNLVLAGDWIDTGLNAGCIESAVMAGVQAANAVVGEPLLRGITGFHLPHHGRAGRRWR